MKKWIWLSLALSMCLPFSVVQSAPITMNFSASGFTAAGSSTVPQDPVTGSFQWEAASTNATIDSLTAVNLTIAGHTYSLSDVGFYSPWGTTEDIIFGSLNNEGILIGTNDFWLIWDRVALTAREFYYSTSSAVDYYYTSSFREFSIAEVPAPAPIALLSIGLVAIGYARKKKMS